MDRKGQGRAPQDPKGGPGQKARTQTRLSQDPKGGPGQRARTQTRLSQDPKGEKFKAQKRTARSPAGQDGPAGMAGSGCREKRLRMLHEEKAHVEKALWPPGNLLYPLPVVLVSCQCPGERPNIITVAWAGTVCSSPAMVSISVRKERYSYPILKETGVFVVNLVTEELVFAADRCGVESGRDVDKYKELGLTPQPSKKIAAPGIEESPVNIECKVEQIIQLGSHDMFIAQVLGVTVDRRYMDAAGKFRLNDTGLVAYSHGEYLALGESLGKFGYSVQKNRKGRG